MTPPGVCLVYGANHRWRFLVIQELFFLYLSTQDLYSRIESLDLQAYLALFNMLLHLTNALFYLNIDVDPPCVLRTYHWAVTDLFKPVIVFAHDVQYMRKW